MREYRCAICGRPTSHERELPDVYPFCSPRCQRVDLGKWLHEEYAIDRDLTPDEARELLSQTHGPDTRHDHRSPQPGPASHPGSG